MGGDSVVVGAGTARILSNAPSHEVLVELEVRDDPPPQPGPEFVPLGEWVYMSGSGQVMLCSLDGPELRLDLAADTAYVLRRWRKGGDSAAERFEELAGGSSTSASPRPAPTRPATNPLWTRSVNSATRGASA